MKNKKISIIAMLALMMISGQIWVAQADSSTAQDKALAYIENVLPLHIDKFQIKLKIDGYATDIPQEFNTHNISFDSEDKILIYYVGSRVGTMDTLNVIFAVRNDTIYKCAVHLNTGPNIGQSSLKEAATIFLTRYQTYSGLNTTAMVNMLSLDLTHDATITSGNLTMTIQHTGASGGTTEFTWIYPNGSDYFAFEVSFQNNFPVSFYDERQIPTITPTPTQLPTNNTGPEPPKTEPFLTTLAIVIVVSVAVVGVGLLVCFKKRQRSKSL